LIGALFFVGTEITRETLKELRLSAVLHGLALWALVIPAVLVAVIAWVP
jgi:Kef-type K+ transport system membrane component KefB